MVVITLLFFAAMYAISPLQVDDFWYLGDSYGKPVIDAFMITVAEMVDHLNYDTGRLANIINPPFLTIIPQWIYGLLSTVCIWILLYVGRRMTSISVQSFRAFLLLTGIVVALPWTDYMFSIVQSLNYLWSSAMMLPAIWYVMRAQKGEPFGAGKTIAISALCFLAGWMHEGFSIPILFGLAVYALVLLERPRKTTLLFVAMMTLGAVCIFLPPAFWSRLQRTDSFLSLFTGWEMISSILVFNCLYFVLIAVLGMSMSVMRVRRRILRERRQLAMMAFFFASASASVALFVLYYTGSRMSWLPQLMSGLGVLYCFGFYRFRLHAPWRWVWGGLVSLLLCAHYCMALKRQTELTRECGIIVEKYLDSPSGVVFYDNIKPTVDLSLWKPSFRQFNLPYASGKFSEYYKPGRPQLNLFPSALKCVDLNRAKPTSDTSLIIYGRHILALHPVSEQRVKHLEGKMKNGDWISSRFLATEFTDSAGNNFVLITPHLQTVFPDIEFQDVRLL